jgi:hypothetical protein
VNRGVECKTALINCAGNKLCLKQESGNVNGNIRRNPSNCTGALVQLVGLRIISCPWLPVAREIDNIEVTNGVCSITDRREAISAYALLLNVVGLLCIVLLLVCASLFTYVYCFTVCVLLSLSDCLLEVSSRKVLRPATSGKVFLGFPVSKCECWDGSQDSRLLLHASHVALPT